jgi:hypothetical protein
MKIETKFNIGEEIFFLNDGKIVSHTIEDINTRSKNIGKEDDAEDTIVTEVSYMVKIGNKNSVLDYNYKSVAEKDAFVTREELIQSL